MNWIIAAAMLAQTYAQTPTSIDELARANAICLPHAEDTAATPQWSGPWADCNLIHREWLARVKPLLDRQREQSDVQDKAAIGDAAKGLPK